jgi:hypothetical protein
MPYMELVKPDTEGAVLGGVITLPATLVLISGSLIIKDIEDRLPDLCIAGASRSRPAPTHLQ